MTKSKDLKTSSEQEVPKKNEDAVKPSKPKVSKASTSKPVDEVVEEPVVEAKKKAKAAPKKATEVSAAPTESVPTETSSKSSKASKKVAEPVSAPEPEDNVDEPSQKQRRVVNRDEVEKSFDSVLESLEAEVESFRETPLDAKARGRVVKFLRTVGKQVKQLKTDFLKLSTKKKTKTCSANSGFMKAVKISSDMHKFSGTTDDQLVSRVDVTKSICKYIKDHNLQNESDRRLFTPDEKLAKLLGSKTPCTYYNLQKAIQPHFLKSA
jgi:chromatin remodeling complex protein RSC6